MRKGTCLDCGATSITAEDSHASPDGSTCGPVGAARVRVARKKPVALTRRSMDYARDLGGLVAVVERRDQPRYQAGPDGKPGPRFGKTHDAFGFADLLVLCPPYAILAVQVTDGSHVAHRVGKMRGVPEDTTPKALAAAAQVRAAALAWLRCGGRIQVWGWRRPTKTRTRWERRVVEVGLACGAESVHTFERDTTSGLAGLTVMDPALA